MIGEADRGGSGKLKFRGANTSVLAGVEADFELVAAGADANCCNTALASLESSLARVIRRERGLEGRAESDESRLVFPLEEVAPVLVFPTSINTVAISHHCPNSSSRSSKRTRSLGEGDGGDAIR